MVEVRPNPYAAPSRDQLEVPPSTNPAPRLGAWLIVSLVGLFVVCGMCGIGLVRVVIDLESWLALATRAPLEYLRVALVAANFAMASLGISWMLRRDRRLPRLMLVYYAIQTLISIYVVLQLEPNGGTEAYRAGYVMGSWLFPLRGVAWIVYFRRSERVEATFVR